MNTEFTRRALVTGALCGICAAGGYAFGLRHDKRPPATTDDTFVTRTGTERAAAQPDGLFRVRTNEPFVALTFDDGPDPTYTSDVLDLLERHRAGATFFVVGVNALAHTELLKRTIGDGHSIGNHTYDHRELELLDAAGVRVEIDRGERSMVRAGAPNPNLFRPPKGFTDEVVGVLADAERYRTVFWDVCVERFVNHQPVTRGVAGLLARIGPGSIILAHDSGIITGSGRSSLSRARTMQALPLLLEGLAAAGLTVVDVPTLLRRTGGAS